jgi:hypothetical protein
VPKALLNVWHKAGYLEAIYSKFLEVRECGKVTQGATAKRFGSKFFDIMIIQVDMKSLDEWE